MRGVFNGQHTGMMQGLHGAAMLQLAQAHASPARSGVTSATLMCAVVEPNELMGLVMVMNCMEPRTEAT